MLSLGRHCQNGVEYLDIPLVFKNACCCGEGPPRSVEFDQDTKRAGIKISLCFCTPTFTAALFTIAKEQK